MNETIKPRIYVACVAAYNSGRLHGQWIDITDFETVTGQINAMLKASPIPNAEEWAIHDSESLGNISEHENIQELCDRAEFISEHGTLGIELLDYANSLDDAKLYMDEYCGEYDSEIHYAHDLIDSCYDTKGMHELFLTYFDYESFARDLFMTDYFSLEVDSKTHVFRSC